MTLATPQKILVTGGSGFLGSHVADALSDAGHVVTIFDRRASDYLRPSQRMVVGDLSDESLLDDEVARADVIFHLAALADLNDAKHKPVETVLANVLPTVRLLEAAVKNELKRFVFASSVYVYSREGSFYRCSKQACESYIEEYAARRHLKFTILRFGSLYGPRTGRTNGVYRLLDDAMSTGKISYTGASSDMREYIHVEDAAKLSVKALEDEFENRHLVLTGVHPMRIGDLFTMFSELLGRKIDVEYLGGAEDNHDGKAHGHYSVTPYAYTPRPGLKMTTPVFIDMGQGLLRIAEEIDSGTTHE